MNSDATVVATPQSQFCLEYSLGGGTDADLRSSRAAALVLSVPSASGILVMTFPWNDTKKPNSESNSFWIESTSPMGVVSVLRGHLRIIDQSRWQLKETGKKWVGPLYVTLCYPGHCFEGCVQWPNAGTGRFFFIMRPSKSAHNFVIKLLDRGSDLKRLGQWIAMQYLCLWGLKLRAYIHDDQDMPDGFVDARLSIKQGCVNANWTTTPGYFCGLLRYMDSTHHIWAEEVVFGLREGNDLSIFRVNDGYQHVIVRREGNVQVVPTDVNEGPKLPSPFQDITCRQMKS